MADETPQIVQIPVKKYDVNLTIQDLMIPLTALAQQAHVAQSFAINPEVQQHATELANLAKQILEVAGRLNAVAPHLLSPTREDSQGR